ncbi:ATP synthase 8 [Gossypium arboreum]|uniref:ATP synthase 8 n=1 Tax=Gossypium arboreum TaxID=29729 RepID=A0A0B0MTH6_GOSAR|nr:ATP synthase 8 [Gossypium arboreum]
MKLCILSRIQLAQHPYQPTHHVGYKSTHPPNTPIS